MENLAAEILSLLIQPFDAPLKSMTFSFSGAFQFGQHCIDTTIVVGKLLETVAWILPVVSSCQIVNN